MTEERFTIDEDGNITDTETGRTLYVENKYTECNYFFRLLNQLSEENEQLKAQLYCDNEEGVCNNCKHHYLVKDDEVELAYYNSRCKKGHYECARVSLRHCKDFEKVI